MKRIVLIACSKRKKSTPSPAKELYISTLFKFSRQYANLLNPDITFILSAKHGLLELEKVIDSYDQTLSELSEIERREWSKKVVDDLKKIANIESDHFTILAGNNYCKYILPHLGLYIRPLEGLSIGKQLQYLKDRIKNE